MRLARSSGDDFFNVPKVVQTPKDYQEGLEVFKKFSNDADILGKIKAIVGGMAGPLDKEKTMTASPPNLPGWKMKPLKKDLEELLKAPVFLENDADIAGLGEATFGAGKGYDILAYLTISTGVGGGRIVKGKIDENSMGFEVGHQIIDADSSIFPETRKFEKQIKEKGWNFGSLSSYISGSAIKMRYGKEPKEIFDENVWEELAKILAIGLNNTIVHWSPDAVILGGSVMNRISIDRVKFHLKQTLKIFVNHPEIKKAELEDQSGLYGALALIAQMKK